MPKELIIYCDESTESGAYYSDFYGGVLVSSDFFESVVATLDEKKVELNMFGEVKWSKVTASYLEKYIALMDVFFDLMESGVVKVRIMFRQSSNMPINLSAYNKEHSYFMLYYQFVKHVFGLQYNDFNNSPIYLKLFFDELPDSKAKSNLFKKNILGLQNLPMFDAFNIRKRDIAEVDSKKHVLLQCMDVVLGSMSFRLNNLHKAIPKGAKRRGKRTVAKEKLYKHILKRIRRIYPNFNIGMSTGMRGDKTNIWKDSYRHWSFVPSEHKVDKSKFK